jgi:hypothetical protein
VDTLALGVSVLDKNLEAIRAISPRVAELIEQTPGRPDVTFAPASVQPTGGPDGGEGAGPVLTASIEEWTIAGMTQRALASRRDPIVEAKRLVERVDVRDSAAVLVLGFGLGYHVAELARSMGKAGVLFVFEPDVALLRAVFERIDCSGWLKGSNVAFFVDADDEAAIAARADGLEGLLAMGLTVLEHPGSLPRLGDLATRFSARFTRVFQAVRTSVVTTMVQTEATLRNLTQNLDHYATAPGVGELRGVLAGRAAIVVSAGPSLARNLEALSRPEAAERFCIIATQTVLKTLLSRGIRPHFVTALDFHQISTRFYEGLSPRDVEGVTLVVEPKVNPAVPAAFPGAVRVVGDQFLETLLGPGLAPKHAVLPAGATVAHLAYYLARHLGCDPVVLVGQDLGFTDGQYYSAGAAIHSVWAGELNEFNTLEMLEWERIVRMRPQLRRLKDRRGKPIYTDEQMHAYLVQFQRDFQADELRGLTTIDAGDGVDKAHTRARDLNELIDEQAAFGSVDDRPIADCLPRAEAPDATARRRTLRGVCERLREVRREVWQVARHSRQAQGLLEQMLARHEEQEHVNDLIGQVEKIRDQVTALDPAYPLVQHLNQTGGFNRHRADRRIHLAKQASELSPLQEQRERIRRDITNVQWLGDAADVLGGILDESAIATGGGAKRTREPAPGEIERSVRRGGDTAPRAGVAALLALDLKFGGLGLERDPAAPIWQGRTALNLTLSRLARCPGLDRIVVLCADERAARAIAGEWPKGAPVEFRAVAPERTAWDGPSRRAARLWSADSWRGGLGNATCYDEAIWPGAMAGVLGELGLDSALIVGADWALVDPALCAQVLERHREDPASNRLAFTQAAPGLAGCVIDRRTLQDLANGRPAAGSFASLGGVLGYVPTAPVSDPLAKSPCVGVEPAVRDALLRCIPDSPERGARLLAALRRAGLDAATASAGEIARALEASDPAMLRAPRCVHIEMLDAAGAMIDVDRVIARLRGVGPALGEAGVTILAGGFGEALSHPRLGVLIDHLRSMGVGGVHVRTGLRCPAAAVESLIAAAPDVISVDLVSEDPSAYAAITGQDVFGAVRENFGRLLSARRLGPGGLPTTWIVPRIMRRDAVLDQIEGFFDHWMLNAGWAVIDPPPERVEGERLTALPLPELARRRLGLGRLVLRPGAEER